jgi:hypothetical protein
MNKILLYIEYIIPCVYWAIVMGQWVLILIPMIYYCIIRKTILNGEWSDSLFHTK